MIIRHLNKNIPFWLSLVLFCAILFLSFRNHTPRTDSLAVHYRQKIEQLQTQVAGFRFQIRSGASPEKLKALFLQSRLAYKKMAVLTEYFNRLETSFLNAPAISRLASDDPDSLLAPSGFQAIENLLYGSWNEKMRPEADTLSGDVQRVLNQLLTASGEGFNFRLVYVWDALRSSVLQVITLGITGFDSPLAAYSIPEAAASLEGIKEILKLAEFEGLPEADINGLLASLDQCIAYLQSHPEFNRFNRMDFITGFADPLYREINRIRIKNEIGFPDGSNPLNPSSLSIFDRQAFDLNFFSPGPQYLPTPERASLGKQLFFDNILSGNKTRNCSSCHFPERAFADGLKTPLALDHVTPLLRNSPTLLNSVFQTRLFYDSRVVMLEGQHNRVIHDTKEMQGSLEAIVRELSAMPSYTDLFRRAYPDEPEPLNTFTVTNAIASYIRMLTALDSRFDQYMRGNHTQLNAREKNGFNLFAGKARCATCHFIPLFNGLLPPVFNETESEVLGVPAAAARRKARLDTDPGKAGFSHSVIHRYAFKTPTIRNSVLTAPYMHNGVYNSLEEVIRFYNKGGGRGLGIAPENQTLPFEKLQLNRREQKDLIAFISTLTDTVSFRQN